MISTWFPFRRPRQLSGPSLTSHTCLSRCNQAHLVSISSSPRPPTTPLWTSLPAGASPALRLILSTTFRSGQLDQSTNPQVCHHLPRQPIILSAICSPSRLQRFAWTHATFSISTSVGIAISRSFCTHLASGPIFISLGVCSFGPSAKTYQRNFTNGMFSFYRWMDLYLFHRKKIYPWENT